MPSERLAGWLVMARIREDTRTAAVKHMIPNEAHDRRKRIVSDLLSDD